MEKKRRYTLMAFPQGFDGNIMDLNIILIPRNMDPFIDTDTGLAAPLDKTAAFASMKPTFVAGIVKGLDEFPISNTTSPGRVPVTVALTIEDAVNKFSILDGIAKSFPGQITKTASDKAEDVVKEEISVSKYLPHSYRDAFNFSKSRHPNARTDDSYHCAIRDQKPKAIVPFNDEVSWGKLYAHILRQPVLAEACGMLYRTKLVIDPLWFKDGGYLYIDMTNSDVVNVQPTSLEDAQGPFVKRYAARIPKLKAGESRSVFAPLLFPVLYRKTSDLVDPQPPDGEWDKIFSEVNEYNDGFAKIVHTMQPPSGNLMLEKQDGFHPVKDIGIRLAWDDEQIMLWYIRQLTENPSQKGSGERLDAPLGILGYHLDVKEDLPGMKWESLNMVRAKEDYLLKGNPIGKVKGKEWELPFQVYPTQLADNDTYWLPMYYANWIGRSMVMKDHNAAAIYQNDLATVKGDAGTPANVSLDQLFDEVAPSAQLLYGNAYQFRVRLSDISGGGPKSGDEPVNDAPTPFSRVHFKRFIAPSLLRVSMPDPEIMEKMEFFNEQDDGSGNVSFNDNPVLSLQRPLLGYPAVVFTGKYQKAGKDPIALLIKASKEMIGSTAFGIADPDVVKVEVKVEVGSLRMDKQLSETGQEDYAILYTTNRYFEGDFIDALNISVTFKDAPVLSYGGDRPLGDTLFTMAEIDAMKDIVLPTARRVRITLRAVCDGNADYFGFINKDDNSLDTRFGKTTQLWFYKESNDESKLLGTKANVPAIQALYLQPDPPLVNDGTLATLFLQREGSNNQPDIVQRLAAHLGVECKGLTLVSRKGERVVFGCSSRIRHTLAPDHSSITFASKEELIHHWLGCIVQELQRDWTWDALQDVSFIIDRYKRFRRDPESDAEHIDSLGEIEVKHTVSFEALQPDAYGNINRERTTLIYIDAIEPKASLKTSPSGEPRFPDEIVVRYGLTPVLKSGHGAIHDDITMDELLLPVTTVPAQIPTLLSAGIALSPYIHDDTYSNTEPRKRYLWLEFSEAVKDPHDTIFCRVLAKAPDQLLSNNHPELFVAPEEPLLAIDPEYTRMVTTGQSDDMSGLSAMQPMEKALDSDTHYILPIPPGLNPESPELFGFFTYEFRIGHGHWTDKDSLWSTAQGRFGRALRVTGIQHPAPTLLCAVNRNEEMVYVNAPFAQAVFSGKNVTARPPRTQLWCLLYAQVKRADGKLWRNILLNEKPMPWNERLFKHIDEEKKYQGDLNNFLKPYILPKNKAVTKLNFLDPDFIAGTEAAIFKDKPPSGLVVWYDAEILELLSMLGLPADAPLSVLVVEVFGNITSLREQFTNPDDLRNSTASMELLRRSGLDGVEVVQETYDQLRSMNETNAVRQGMSPLARELGNFRILRTSPLTAVPGICCQGCKQYRMQH